MLEEFLALGAGGGAGPHHSTHLVTRGDIQAPFPTFPGRPPELEAYFTLVSNRSPPPLTPHFTQAISPSPATSHLHSSGTP